MTEATAPNAAPCPGYGTKPYRAYVLGALLAVYTFNFIDRVVIAIIQQPIKAEFGLTDLQLGLLGGPAFAVLYTLLGIPIARLAEKHNRMTILAICLGIWSGMTALCGIATSYTTLLMARIGVSIGEAGCTPPAQSVISDYFPADKRATAISIYALGVPVGSMLAAIGGGFIATAFGWRETFLMLGLPGLLLAIVVKLTIKEPPRAGSTVGVAAPSFVTAFKVLATKPTFWHVALGSAVASFVGYGVGQFLNSYLERTHGLSLFNASMLTGAVLGVAAAFGTFFAGWLADRVIQRHPNALLSGRLHGPEPLDRGAVPDRRRHHPLFLPRLHVRLGAGDRGAAHAGDLDGGAALHRQHPRLRPRPARDRRAQRPAGQRQSRGRGPEHRRLRQGHAGGQQGRLRGRSGVRPALGDLHRPVRLPLGRGSLPAGLEDPPPRLGRLSFRA